MEYEVGDAIDAAFNGNTTDFQDAINSILGNKVRERVGVERIAVAQSFFNGSDASSPEEDTEYNEDYSDEDI